MSLVPEGRAANHDDCVEVEKVVDDQIVKVMPCKMTNLATTIPPRRERRGTYRQYPRRYTSDLSRRTRTGGPRWLAYPWPVWVRPLKPIDLPDE